MVIFHAMMVVVTSIPLPSPTALLPHRPAPLSSLDWPQPEVGRGGGVPRRCMSAAGGAFGGARGLAAKPPERGVFPLDHGHECQRAAGEYLACLRRHAAEAHPCRGLSKAYLECRMQR